jgi:hypothetical protein
LEQGAEINQQEGCIMATWSSKHGKREQTFFIKTFNDGLNQETSPAFLPITALTRCKNMRYILDKSPDGQPIVVMAKRQGTEKLSNTALGSAAKACTYYIAGAQYIVATDSKIYYLNASDNPIEIGSISGLPTFTEFKGKLIIHDSGVTKAWNGTTFETLNCLYQNEIIGTGNNSDVDFTGTLAHPAIKPGSVSITYTDGTLKTITDDGAGNLIGDKAADTNTIDYTSGHFHFRCSGAPDNATSIYAEYEKVAGAPKSKAGLIRASRLYMWGDSDNPSRLWYCGPNDEDGWDSSSSGGYLDVDPLDGYSLIGCSSFYAVVIAIKGNSVHRINAFPGDTTFRVEPLMENTGSIAYRTLQNDGTMVSFLSKEGWLGLTATQLYGDIQKSGDLSFKFRANATTYATANCYTEYSQNDKQLWLTLYNGATQFPSVNVISLETGAQLSLYEFAFGHTCYKFVNGEMLIGGSDGHLYRLYAERARYTDNLVSYTADTYLRGVMTDFGAGFNRKHNKKIFPHIYGPRGFSATLNIYTDGNYTNILNSTNLSISGGDQFIWDDQTSYIYGDTGFIGEETIAERSYVVPKKFNYREVMWELTNIEGALGAEFYGLEFTGAIVGQ